ncbi:hypothetical protein AAH097_03625, partial [Bacteroides uniformis]
FKGALLNVLRGQNRLVLGGSLHWIFQNKEIPFYKSTLSRRSVLRFRRSEIENWILKHRIGTIDEYLDAQDAL